jgi:sulfonate transport system permease protein
MSQVVIDHATANDISAGTEAAGVGVEAKRRRHVPGLRLVSPLVLLGAWALASGTGMISSEKLPTAWTVAKTGWQLISAGTLESNLWSSLERVIVGLTAGVVVGAVLAVAVGLNRSADVVVDPPMQAFRALPVLALVPLFIVWFGIGQEMKYLMIAFAVAFPIYINLSAGIRDIDPKLLEAACTLDLGRLATIRHVVIPGAAASFLVGLRFALATSWLVLVVCEQVNATSGIGYLMQNAENYFRTDIIIVGLIVYAVLGLGSDALVRWGERRLLRWRSA